MEPDTDQKDTDSLATSVFESNMPGPEILPVHMRPTSGPEGVRYVTGNLSENVSGRP